MSGLLGKITDGMVNIILRGYTGANYVVPKIDKSTHSLQTIEYPHHERHGGKTWEVQVFDDAIGNNGEVNISFYVPAGTALPHLTFEYSHEGDMTVTLLQGTTLTLGTGADVQCVNVRHDSANTSRLQGVATGALVSNYVTKNATYSGGTIKTLRRSFAAKNVGNSGEVRRERVLAADEYYTFIIANNETSNQGAQICLEWYEHSDAETV